MTLQLKKEGYRFCKIRRKSKAPFEKEWQLNGYKWNDPELQDWINKGNNYGVIGGYGNLRILDIDNKELAEELFKELDTFAVRTGSGGGHFYFEIEDYDNNHILKNNLGEFRASNYQCVGPNSIHPSGKKYTVKNDISIKLTSINGLKKKLEKHNIKFKETTLTTPTVTTTVKDDSKSGLEWRRVLALVREGKSKEEIFQTMEAYYKWKTSPEQYRDMTYSKAVNYVEKEKTLENDLVISLKNLVDSDILEIEWLCEGFIPKGGIVIIGGDNGSYKTMVALHSSICLASGKPLFDYFQTKKSKVLYIDEENRPVILKSRVKKMLKSLNLNSDLDLEFMICSDIRLDSNIGLNKLNKVIQRFKPDMIVADSLVRVMDGDENSVSDVRKVFSSIKKYLNQGISWLLLHHTRKAKTVYKGKQDLRGSSDFAGFIDILIMNSVYPDSKGYVNISQPKNRLQQDEIKDFSVRIDSTEDTIQLTFDKFSEGKSKAKLPIAVKRSRKLHDYLLQEDITYFSTKDVKEIFPDLGNSEINSALKELELADVVKNTGKRGNWMVKKS